MGVQIKQNADGSMGLPGVDSGDGGFMKASFPYNASSVDATFLVASRTYIVKQIDLRPTVAGTDASAVSVTVRKVPDGTAITSGTALHSSTLDLKGTANTRQTATLSTTATDLVVAPGNAIAADFTGTLTSATGVITVTLAPA